MFWVMAEVSFYKQLFRDLGLADTGVMSVLANLWGPQT
jgi:hypothetical protein